MILLDANVLVYSVNEEADQHADSRAVIEASTTGAVPGVLVPQVLLEFYATVTGRHARNPLSPERAWADVAALRTALPLLASFPQNTFWLLDQVVLEAQPRGAGVFDCFLIGQMRAHGIAEICTYDAGFPGRLGITTRTPSQVLGAR